MGPMAAVQLGSHSMQQPRLCIVLAFCLQLLAVPAAGSKPRRQVVQPLWLMRPELLPSAQAAKVIVTPQNLREVAAIRASIQKAINEDTYVVAANPEQFLATLDQSTSKPFLFAPLPTLPPMPAFRLPNANFWSRA